MQFMAEAVLLSLLGGAIGVVAGVIATAVYAFENLELVDIPAEAWVGGFGAAILIGAVTGSCRRSGRLGCRRLRHCGASERGQGHGKSPVR